MKITVVGSGYVGLVAGACFAEVGNFVTMLDIDSAKIAALEQGIVPIYEPGLSELILKNKKSGNIAFTTDKACAYKNAEIIFIAVGTPMSEDGSADLSYVLAVAKDLAAHITGYTIIVDKSTVPVGSAKKVRQIVLENLADKAATFDVVSNPEFLKEGVAIKDFMSPDRVVLGSESARALKIMQSLYGSFVLKNNRIITMSTESAEMTKYAANAMLATKISFINEVASICEKVGANINDVRLGIGADSRIGYSFIYPGCGYGGSCFPKDIKALAKTAQENGLDSPILTAIERVNLAQKKILGEKVKRRFGAESGSLRGLAFCLWGLAFKPETDDVREASSLVVIKDLLDLGANLRCYDPKASENVAAIFSPNAHNIAYFEDKYEALRGADALIIVTEWKEFRNPDFAKIRESLRHRVIFDGRNIYHNKEDEMRDFEYYFIGGGGQRQSKKPRHTSGAKCPKNPLPSHPAQNSQPNPQIPSQNPLQIPAQGRVNGDR